MISTNGSKDTVANDDDDDDDGGDDDDYDDVLSVPLSLFLLVVIINILYKPHVSTMRGRKEFLLAAGRCALCRTANKPLPTDRESS